MDCKPVDKRKPNWFIGDLVNVDRIRNVFYPLLAMVREKELRLSASLVVDTLADAYGSRRSQSLKPSRDIDAIPIDIALIDKNETFVWIPIRSCMRFGSFTRRAASPR